MGCAGYFEVLLAKALAKVELRQELRERLRCQLCGDEVVDLVDTADGKVAMCAGCKQSFKEWKRKQK